MNGNNKKGKGKGNNKHSDINSFYSTKPAETVDTTPTPTTSVAPVPAATAVDKPVQTIRHPDALSNDTTKWKRVAKPDNDEATEDEEPQAAKVTQEASPDTPITTASDDVPQAPQKATISTEDRTAIVAEGPPPVCRLNEATPPQFSEQASVFEAMREMIANQQKTLELMQQQLKQQYASAPSPMQFPFGFHVPMAMPAMPWMSPMGPVGTMVSTAPAVEQHHHAKPDATHGATHDAKPHHHEKPGFKHHTKHAAAEKADDDADAEFAPFDLKLNTDCPDGFKCPNSKKPVACPNNHNFLGPVIKKGTKLPKFFCKWERPWKKGPNGKALRCRNPACYNSHLEGRDDFIMKANASPEAQ